MYYDEIFTVAQAVWQTMLHTEVTATAPAPIPLESELVARIDINGAWHGRLTARCSERLALRLASNLLQRPEVAVLPQHCRDALAEVVNMLGGGIKALFPGPCSLSLPTVSEPGCHAPPESYESLDCVALTCFGEPFTIELTRAKPRS